MANPGSLRRLLIFLDGFLAVTAIGGSIGLLTGTNAPPAEMLQGSPFTTFTIPGLVLLVLVGGSALSAATGVIRKHPIGIPASMVAGVMIVCFEIVEISLIGSPPGMARNLQILYLLIGILMMVIAIRLRNTSPNMRE